MAIPSGLNDLAKFLRSLTPLGQIGVDFGRMTQIITNRGIDVGQWHRIVCRSDLLGRRTQLVFRDQDVKRDARSANANGTISVHFQRNWIGLDCNRHAAEPLGTNSRSILIIGSMRCSRQADVGIEGSNLKPLVGGYVPRPHISHDQLPKRQELHPRSQSNVRPDAVFGRLRFLTPLSKPFHNNQLRHGREYWCATCFPH